MKILTLDIETSPHEGYSFSVWQTNIYPNQLIRPTSMLSYAAKWLDSKEVIYKTWTDEDFHDTLHGLLNEADMIVGFNHEKFDLRHINREFVERGYFPTRPVPTIDVLKVVKKHFNFPHNRLDYVAMRLLGECKLDTGGFELWPAFMAGDEKALKLMKKYNIQDVKLTEKLYKKLIPWIINHPFIAAPTVEPQDDDIFYQCPACTSHKTTKERPRRTRCYAIRVVHCNACGSWFDGRRRKL